MLKNIKLSDEQLVEIIRTKNKELFSEIIKRYQDKLMRYSTYLIRDHDKAVDIVQNTFIKAYVNLNSFNLNKKFSSWIYRITHNETINMIKKYDKQIPLDNKVDFKTNTNIEDDFIKKELENNTYYCLKQMSQKYSEPLSLYFLEEKSYDEISDILRIPINTVGTRIKRAKILMKKICQNQKK